MRNRDQNESDLHENSIDKISMGNQLIKDAVMNNLYHHKRTFGVKKMSLNSQTSNQNKTNGSIKKTVSTQISTFSDMLNTV